jgi:competence protein ComEA
MNMSLKRYVFVITSVLILLSTAVLASEPADKTRAMMVTADNHPVNVNQASASQIAAGLKGVGLKTATAIVAYRKANGPFETADSLMSVKGVGRRTLVKNEGVIALE